MYEHDEIARLNLPDEIILTDTRNNREIRVSTDDFISECQMVQRGEDASTFHISSDVEGHGTVGFLISPDPDMLPSEDDYYNVVSSTLSGNSVDTDDLVISKDTLAQTSIQVIEISDDEDDDED